MAQAYEKVVQEDLNIGTGQTWVEAHWGGELRSTQVGLHSIARGQKAYTSTWAPGAIATTSNASTTITVPDAAVGDIVIASHSKILTNDLRIRAHVSATDTVTVVIHNPTSASITVASGTLTVAAFPFTARDVVPTAEFTSEPSEGGIVGQGLIQFTDATSGGTPDPGGPPYYTYDWDFGDGTTPHGTDGPDPFLHTYSQGGGANPQTFTVVLTVTDFASATDSVSHDVEVTFNE